MTWRPKAMHGVHKACAVAHHIYALKSGDAGDRGHNTATMDSSEPPEAGQAPRAEPPEGGGAPPPALPALPLDVLQAVCSHLKLRDRLALTCCCHALLERPDVADIQALWGDLSLTYHQLTRGSGRSSAGHLAPLPPVPVAAWLARRRAALRALRVDFAAARTSPLGVLRCVAGGPLTALRLCGSSGLEEAPPPGGLEALHSLTSLRSLELVACGLRQLPSQLAALCGTLRMLNVNGNARLGQGGDAAWQPLAELTGLTRLSAASCALKGPPQQLSRLSGLEQLALQFNQLGGAPPAAWDVLPHLSRLSLLSLEGCQLAALPRQLSALGWRLADLDLTQNGVGLGGTPHLQEGGEGSAWQPLAALTGLTRLRIGMSRLARLPKQLSALRELRELDAGGRGFLGADGACAPLSALRALTLLSLRSCGLRHVPQELAALPALAEADLSDNPGFRDAAGSEATWAGLHGLPALRSLTLATCMLRSLPQQLSALSATLEALELAGNRTLGCTEGGGGALEPLRALTRLTSLGLSACGLLRLPLQLAALTRLQRLDVSYNYDGASSLGAGGNDNSVWEPLEHLTALTFLNFTASGLMYGLPPQLAALHSSLRCLAAGRSPALGRRGAAAWEPLRTLTTLRHLTLWDCGLARVPAQVAALTNLEQLVLSDNCLLVDGEGVWEPLRALPVLSAVDLSNTGLRARPPLPPAVEVDL